MYQNNAEVSKTMKSVKKQKQKKLPTYFNKRAV